MHELNDFRDNPDALRVHGELPVPAAQAWAFVTRPGWFINDDELREHEVTELEAGVHSVLDPVYGEFVVRTVTSREPVLYSFTAAHTGGDAGAPGTVTTFELEDLPRGRCTLTITETGFTGLGLDATGTEEAIDGNVGAWILELSLAAAALTRQ